MPRNLNEIVLYVHEFGYWSIISQKISFYLILHSILRKTVAFFKLTVQTIDSDGAVLMRNLTMKV
jgi:hypothetical protein